MPDMTSTRLKTKELQSYKIDVAISAHVADVGDAREEIVGDHSVPTGIIVNRQSKGRLLNMIKSDILKSLIGNIFQRRSVMSYYYY